MGGGWFFWVALIIGAVIWMIGQLLLRNQEEKGAAGSEARGPAQRRSAAASTDLDRFLQEVNRRKQLAEQRARAQTHGWPVPIPTARPAVDVPPVRRRPPRPIEVAPPRRPAPREEVPVVLEVVPVAEPASPAAMPPPRLAAPAASPALKQLLALLSSKDNLRAAVLLREVLDRPLCHRRR